MEEEEEEEEEEEKEEKYMKIRIGTLRKGK